MKKFESPFRKEGGTTSSKEEVKADPYPHLSMDEVKARMDANNEAARFAATTQEAMDKRRENLALSDSLVAKVREMA